MPLDFKRATDLFLGTEAELARALELDAAGLRGHRQRPEGAPSALVRRLARILDERGRAMIRVAELLEEQAEDAEQQGNGAR